MLDKWWKRLGLCTIMSETEPNDVKSSLRCWCGTELHCCENAILSPRVSATILENGSCPVCECKNDPTPRRRKGSGDTNADSWFCKLSDHVIICIGLYWSMCGHMLVCRTKKCLQCPQTLPLHAWWDLGMRIRILDAPSCYERVVVHTARLRIGQNCRAMCTKKSGLNDSGHRAS